MINNNDFITIHCKNNNIEKEVKTGASLLEIYEVVGAPLKYRPLCAHVNNRVQELTYRCWQSKDIVFLDYTSLPGSRTYVRSLCFILAKVVHDLFPGRPFNLEHSMSSCALQRYTVTD